MDEIIIIILIIILLKIIIIIKGNEIRTGPLYCSIVGTVKRECY